MFWGVTFFSATSGPDRRFLRRPRPSGRRAQPWGWCSGRPGDARGPALRDTEIPLCLLVFHHRRGAAPSPPRRSQKRYWGVLLKHARHEGTPSPGTGRSTARSTARVLRTAQGTMVLRRVYGRAGVPTVVTPNGLYRPGSPGYVSGGLGAAVAPNGIPKNRRGGSRGRRRRLFVDPRTFFGTNH